MAGAIALASGLAILGGVVVQSLTAPAFADTSPFEVFCTDTLLGANIVLNDVTFSGALSPASPSPGQSFSLENFQGQVVLPPSVAQTASSVGSVSGTWSVGVEASGASPSSLPAQDLPFELAAPSNPSSSLSIVAPPNPVTVGPFTATSTNIALTLTPTVDVTFNFAGSEYTLTCTSYPNDVLPSGVTNALPPGAPISPTIATAGQVTTPPPNPVTGPYELYCPHTPVGDLVFNDVSTSATISPGTLSAGDQFQVTGYQTDIPVPPGAVTAAVGLGNASFDGLATSYLDAYGATTSQTATGSMGFDVPIPSPVPSSGLALDIPSSPTTVGPFTASGGPITIAQDQSILVVAELSSKAFKMSCTAYPNDSIATSGSTDTPPAATPIRPVIATASASGTPLTTTTTTIQPGGPGNQTSGAPYELYCPRTPVGDIALNDVVTTGSIAPTSLNEGDQFQVTNLQTQFTIPQGVAQQAENLGLTTLSGDLSLFLDVTGTQYGYNPGTGVGVASTTATASSGSSASPVTTIVGPGPIKGPFPGQDDLSFSVTLPSPVPSTGVQFTATPAPGSQPETFVAGGGPIQVFASGANLNVSAFGDQFGLFCQTFTNDSVPTGLSIHEPNNGFIEPLVATGSATIIPPPPTPPGAQGPYELYCPGTPVGNIALNNVATTGTIAPADPTPGEQFNLTGYQNMLTIPSSIASAAAALGNSAITGTATATVDASGATPAQISTGTMTFDVPLPSPVPVSGVTLTLPTPAQTIGPFTASTSGITISQDASIQLVLVVSGSDLTLRCSAYPNNIEPSGIVPTSPPGSPTSPIIATAGGGAPGVTSAVVSVSPSAGLTSGESVEVSGSGFADNSEGVVSECNTAPGQPTVTLASPVNTSVPVGCTAPTYNLVTTSATGALSTTYTVIEGTVGPPCGASTDIITTCPGADSAGLDPQTDAANYPCPPTAAQQAGGVTCTVGYGTSVGDRASAPIVFSGETPPPPTTPPSTTTTTTAGPSTPSGEITQAYQTLFDFADPSVADKVAVIQNGASLETALSQALSSSLGSSATGAKVNDISFLDSATCTQDNLPSPCAQVTYDILGQGGTVILPNNNGYAVSVNGTWLVATNTVCELLDLFYQAEGKTGTPPGCPATVSSTPTTIVGTGTDATSTSPASTVDASPTSDVPTTGLTTTAPPPTPTTVGAASKATTGSSGSTTPDPVVEANSGSLAFTGLGGVTQWLAIVGGVLVLVGCALLGLVDAPRRLVHRFAHLGPQERWKGPKQGGGTDRADPGTPTEALWVWER